MSSDARLGPGIPVPPPLIYAAAFLTGMVLERLWPFPLLSGLWRHIVGWGLVLVSVLIMLRVLPRFRRAGTPLDVRKAASALITDGPYRFSRNPTYVSLTLLYLGLGALLNNGWIVLLVASVILVMDLWIVRAEERHLEARFGAEYLRYKATVRRWL